MKKIPTLFKREYEDGKVVGITPEVTPGMEWVLEGDGVATLKVDGTCTAIIGGKFYKRYDAKNGKTPPKGAIPCCEPDPVTGHWPHWVEVSRTDPADKWFVKAYDEDLGDTLPDGTYELIGKHFQGNPYGLNGDVLVRHGTPLPGGVLRTFEGIRKYLYKSNIEGIVFWKDGEPQCKIKRSDFGFPWPVKKDEVYTFCK